MQTPLGNVGLWGAHAALGERGPWPKSWAVHRTGPWSLWNSQHPIALCSSSPQPPGRGWPCSPLSWASLDPALPSAHDQQEPPIPKPGQRPSTVLFIKWKCEDE